LFRNAHRVELYGCLRLHGASLDLTRGRSPRLRSLAPIPHAADICHALVLLLRRGTAKVRLGTHWQRRWGLVLEMVRIEDRAGRGGRGGWRLPRLRVGLSGLWAV